MSLNEKMKRGFPFDIYSKFPSLSGKKNYYYRYRVNKHYPLYRGRRFDEYIITGLSSAPYNESHIKLSLGYKHSWSLYSINHGVKVLKCSEYDIQEVCRVPLPSKPFQTEWVPSHPQLLAVANNDIRFYEYENENLTLKESFHEEIYNPVVSIDWNRRQAGKMLITRENGEVVILSLEYGIPIQLMNYRENIFHPICGARFGTGEMENCIILINDNYEIKVFDRQLISINPHLPWNHSAVFNVECSKQNDYLIAMLTKKEVFLYDMRNFRYSVESCNDFVIGEEATCLYWSPHSSVIYIGTSTGGIVKWRTAGNRRPKRYYNHNKKISSIHCPESNSNFFLSTCYDSVIDPYATSIENYFGRMF